MRTKGLWWGFIVLSAAPVALAQPQPPAQLEAPARDDWLQAMVAAYERNREQLEVVDCRNRKLFGNAEFFKDINERELFVSDTDYQGVIENGRSWVIENFPSVAEAASTRWIEECANEITNSVYVRGFAGDLYFAAVVPLQEMTSFDGTLGQVYSITFLREDPRQRMSDGLVALRGQAGDQQAAALQHFLAQFGDVRIDRVNENETQDGLAYVLAEGALHQRGIEGKLHLTAGGSVLHVRLVEPRRRNPFPWNGPAIRFRRRENPGPDWRRRDRNVVVGGPKGYESGEPCPTPTISWLPPLIRECAPYRDALVSVDWRNGKLFGNAEFFRDIDECYRFRSKSQYDWVIGGGWFMRAFSVVREAKTEREIESCANYTVDAVFVRGRAGDVYFAGAVPLRGMLEGELGRFYSVTFLKPNAQLSDDLFALSGQNPEQRPETLQRLLSQFGDVRIDRVRDVTTRDGGVDVLANGALREGRIEGQLHLFASGPVLRLELTEPSEPHPLPGSPTPLMVGGGEPRKPDFWSPDRNVIPPDTGPTTASRPCPVASSDWLPALIESCAPWRQALVSASERNRKLFGNLSILCDIDEQERFTDVRDYQRSIQGAGACFQELFPILADAFAAKRVEACANLCTGQVYLRGRADAVDFAGAIPIMSALSARPGPWSITFVSRVPDREDGLAAISTLSDAERAQALTGYLSRFGAIEVEKVYSLKAESQPAGLRFDGRVRFNTPSFDGRLKAFVAPPVLYMELSEVHAEKVASTKPGGYSSHPGDYRWPNWTGENNVQPFPPRPPPPP